MHSGLILLLVVTMAASVWSSPVERFNCDSIGVVGRRLHTDCKQARDAGLSAMFERLLEDQIITGDEFIGELNATCGDPAVRSRYMHCVQGVTSDCPEISNIIINSLTNDFSVFCDNDRPATWLQTVFQTDYEYYASCHNRSSQANVPFATCASETMGSVQVDDTSFERAYQQIQQLVRKMFDCTANRISEKMLTEDRVPDCGAKWPDVFLSYWLHSIGMGHMSTTGAHEINTLMAMKEAQQNDAPEMMMIDF